MAVKNRKRGAQHDERGFIDDTWTWIEGQRNGIWFPLYCYRDEDFAKAQAVVAHIKREIEQGRKPRDVREFSDFRVHPCGVYMESEISLADIKSIVGLENLARILANFNKTECGVRKKSTGEVCMRKPGHSGKHSPIKE